LLVSYYRTGPKKSSNLVLSRVKSDRGGLRWTSSLRLKKSRTRAPLLILLHSKPDTLLPFSFSFSPPLSSGTLLPPHPTTPCSKVATPHALRFLYIVHVAQRQATPIIHGVEGEEGCCHRSGLGHALICHTGGPPPPGPSSPSDPPHRRAATAKRAHGALRSTARVGHHRRQGPVHPQIHRIGGPPQPKGPMAPSDLPHGRATTAARTHAALRSTTREGHCHR
jgi:hypothetical protein